MLEQPGMNPQKLATNDIDYLSRWSDFVYLQNIYSTYLLDTFFRKLSIDCR